MKEDVSESGVRKTCGVRLFLVDCKSRAHTDCCCLCRTSAAAAVLGSETKTMAHQHEGAMDSIEAVGAVGGVYDMCHHELCQRRFLYFSACSSCVTGAVCPRTGACGGAGLLTTVSSAEKMRELARGETFECGWQVVPSESFRGLVLRYCEGLHWCNTTAVVTYQMGDDDE